MIGSVLAAAPYFGAATRRLHDWLPLAVLCTYQCYARGGGGGNSGYGGDFAQKIKFCVKVPHPWDML